MPEDILGCHSWMEGTTGIQQVETKDASKHATVQRPVLYNRLIWSKMSTIPKLRNHEKEPLQWPRSLLDTASTTSRPHLLPPSSGLLHSCHIYLPFPHTNNLNDVFHMLGTSVVQGFASSVLLPLGYQVPASYWGVDQDFKLKMAMMSHLRAILQASPCKTLWRRFQTPRSTPARPCSLYTCTYKSRNRVCEYTAAWMEWKLVVSYESRVLSVCSSDVSGIPGWDQMP